MVTVPVGSATSKTPDRASRIELINNWVAAVLSVEGGGMYWLNAWNVAHIVSTVRCLKIRDKVRAQAQKARRV